MGKRRKEQRKEERQRMDKELAKWKRKEAEGWD